MGWIGVDLDGTLAEYHGWKGAADIGPPIPAMHNRVLEWIRQGKEVKCFTARAFIPDQVPTIRAWLDEHGMEKVGITCIKDFCMLELWDDRCIQVIVNTGNRVDQNAQKIVIAAQELLELLRAQVHPDEPSERLIQLIAAESVAPELAAKLTALEKALKSYA